MLFFFIPFLRDVFVHVIINQYSLEDTYVIYVKVFLTRTVDTSSQNSSENNAGLRNKLVSSHEGVTAVS